MTENTSVYPVYILERVAAEIFWQCQRAVPKETLGKLLGYRCRWEKTDYVKIVDWVSGNLESDSAYARFTTRGLRECELFLDERYGAAKERPMEVGLFHSHPFGSEPHFSMTDHQTFLTFPYDRLGNVFALIDPISRYFKMFIIEGDGEKTLKQVPWICYSPEISL